jgi:Putative peptidoglycan binding domain/L,D-transpeptidase catalytic domain
VKKLLGGLSAAVLAVGLVAASPTSGDAGVSASAPAMAGHTPHDKPHQKPDHKPHFSMRQKWAREVTRYGDADTSVYHIQHVRELQYRLTWAGVFDSTVNGQFGKATRAAVKQYQEREGLHITGMAGHLTWAHLIHDTIRRRGMIPRICATDGWHACYDRYAHQVTLWHDGEMKNSWLVRGGEYGIETRLGTHTVYSRDIDHVSRLFDAPMPYAQFFDGGQALHGSVYMIDPFVDHSHGCVNMFLEDARQLWNITSDKKLVVTVYGAWD